MARGLCRAPPWRLLGKSPYFFFILNGNLTLSHIYF